MSYNNGVEWAKTLKVGDTVCDCRYRHLRIKKLEPDYVARCPKWMDNLQHVPFWAWSLWDRLACKFGYQRLVDVTLTLEDDSTCSAVSCCHPPDHQFSHPDK